VSWGFRRETRRLAKAHVRDPEELRPLSTIATKVVLSASSSAWCTACSTTALRGAIAVIRGSDGMDNSVVEHHLKPARSDVGTSHLQTLGLWSDYRSASPIHERERMRGVGVCSVGIIGMERR